LENCAACTSDCGSYDPAVTTALSRVLIALSIMLAALIFIGFGWIVNQGLWENICFDRVPW
jgi:uncharacterized protein (DUF983 family)